MADCYLCKRLLTPKQVKARYRFCSQHCAEEDHAELRFRSISAKKYFELRRDSTAKILELEESMNDLIKFIKQSQNPEVFSPEWIRKFLDEL
jgi:hypothetical protein